MAESDPFGELAASRARLMPPMVPQYTLPPVRAEYDSDGNVISMGAQPAIAKDNRNAQDDPGDYIRRLIIETNAAVRPDKHTGLVEDRLLGNRPKLPNRRLADRRRAYFMDRLLKTYGKPELADDPARGTMVKKFDGYEPKPKYRYPESWRALSPQLAGAMMDYATADKANVKGDYENTGWVGPGSTLGTIGTWMMSMPAMAYGASEGLANAVGGKARSNKQIYDDVVRAGGTFWYPLAARIAPDAERIPGTSHFTDMSLAREAADNAESFDRDRTWWQNLDDSAMHSAIQSLESSAGSVDGGEELLNRYDVDDLIGRLGTRGLGGVMDATTNIFFGGPEIIGAARAGKALKSAGMIGLEYGPDAAIAGARTYLENQQ